MEVFMFDLKGKKALVTGGSRGIGKGIVLALAQQGADVAINYRKSDDKAKEVAQEAKDLGREAWVVQADVSDNSQIKQMFNQVKEKWGKLDILVNNAGILNYAPFAKVSEEQFDKLLAVNLKGQFFCSQEAVKLMNKGSKIINIASISSGGVGVAFPAITHYTASKGGVVAMTEGMALELGPDINVNAVAPGAIETDMSRNEKGEVDTSFLPRIPKKRIGQPKDIGAAVAFLASDEADYITGTVTYVDGGWLTG